ncbi:MAG: hypothetical protein O2894_05855, partial [Planctomycetota bacterium]|nr:hypothetical protein [Planctomycetota bacterium]
VAATQPARDAGQPARDAGFDTFLRGAGETATGIPFDLERALDKAVAASKRDPVPPREGEGYCPWALEDEIDRIACERGVSREHARQLHSNRPYAEPEAGR